MKKFSNLMCDIFAYIAAVIACSLLLVLIFILVLFSPTSSVYGFKAFAETYNKRLDKIFEKKRK